MTWDHLPKERRREFNVDASSHCFVPFDTELHTESTHPSDTNSGNDSNLHPSQYGAPICEMRIGDARHLELDFKLVDENGFPRIPESGESEILFNLFPQTVGVGICGPFLWITVETLPSRPWHVSVAGLPLYLSTNDFDIPWRTGGPGNPQLSVLESLDSRCTTSEDLYHAAVDFFDSKSIEIYQVAWTIGGWQVEIDANVDKSLLPARICQSPVGYLPHGARIGIDAALRLKQPLPSKPDDSAYEILRPGIMVTASRAASTAGVLVKDEDGNEYMTVAAHAFPSDDASVRHPHPQSASIGAVVSRIGSTDIGLVLLNENVVFQNQTFSSAESEGGVCLKGVRKPASMKPYERLHMENSLTGSTDAMFIHARLQRFPSVSSNPYTWVWQDWAWAGQDAAHIPVKGSCGSALFDEDGNVVSFFHFIETQKNIGIGVSAYELIKAGYSLVTLS